MKKQSLRLNINGDAQYYGCRKIAHYLRGTYNFVINFKKMFRFCEKLSILRNQGKIYSEVERILDSDRTVIDLNMGISMET